jgi:glycine hydroxymethyltransferase
MAQIVANAQALARGLQERGIPCLAALKGFTRSHQAIADVRSWGGGYAAAIRLQAANIIVNKNLIPGDRAEDWDRPSGIRIGTIEVTRLGMGPGEMGVVAEFMHDVLVKGEDPEAVRRRVVDFRRGFQRLYYCFENGLPDLPGLQRP